MTSITLERQIITDTASNPIGVILPLEEYALVEKILDQYYSTLNEENKLAQMEKAATDPLFMADLQEAMSTFSRVDSEWWESAE